MPCVAETFRRCPAPLLAVVAAGLGLLAVHQVVDLTTVSVQDYVEYWAAGRLNAQGLNPYDSDALYHQELQASPALTEAIMMWNPPWTLAVAMPFGLLPARAGFVAWLWLNLSVVLVCADWLWGYFGGPARRRWLAWAVCLLFAPTFFVLRMGQITPLILLALVGFLYFEQHGRLALAGAAVALAAIKPHLALFVGLALLLWAVDRRRWSVLAGGALMLAILTAIPLACNPQVLRQYQDAMTHSPPRMLSPTLGALLRVAFGLDKLWLQYVPAGFGLAWFAFHWSRHCRRWVWAEQVPVLLIASFLTASYGAWQFDLVVLLIPVLQLAVWVSRPDRSRDVGFALMAFLGFDAIALFLMDIRYTDQYWHVWMTPMILYCYLSLRRGRAPAEPTPQDEDPMTQPVGAGVSDLVA
jgi:hypothetical protein